MSGYVLANVSWMDQDARWAYADLLGPSLDAHGGVVIAGTQDVRVMEGDRQPNGVMVLISFPTLEDGLEWYNSEEYRPALEIRKRSASSRLLIFGDWPDRLRCRRAAPSTGNLFSCRVQQPHRLRAIPSDPHRTGDLPQRSRTTSLPGVRIEGINLHAP
jgi:uncharacterized protein (DUF1330 family)